MSFLEGIILRICNSPVRPGHKRKNWREHYPEERSIRFSKGLCPVNMEGAKYVRRRTKSHRADFAYSGPRKTDFLRRAFAYAGFNQERAEKQITQFTGRISTIYNEERYDNGKSARSHL